MIHFCTSLIRFANNGERSELRIMRSITVALFARNTPKVGFCFNTGRAFVSSDVSKASMVSIE